MTNPLFAVDDDDATATGGAGAGTTTQGGTSEPTSDPGTSEPGTSTSTSTTEATTAEPDPVCGDGKMEGSEECDDGNDIDTDSCRNGCKLAVCGDGVVDTNHEACDDSNQVDDDDCTNECKLTTCGDGVVDPNEQCDDGNGDNTDDCTEVCLSAQCGDGFVQSGVEECDDGDDDKTDGCPACALAICGDGFVHTDEECDDGNDVETDECISACKKASCGDGHVQGDEICDEGPNNDPMCPDCKPPAVCGDGVISGDEQCDYNAPPYQEVGVPVCSKECQLFGCSALLNTVGHDFSRKPTKWLDWCTFGQGKTVVLTLIGQDRQVVYMAKGTISGDWTTTNLTSGGISHASEYDVKLHKRPVNLDRIRPVDDLTDVLMLTSANASPSNDPACYTRLGDGYGVVVYSNALDQQKPKLLVMGANGGVTGMHRWPHFDGEDEISYDELGMDVCAGTTPFLGGFLLSVFP